MLVRCMSCAEPSHGRGLAGELGEGPESNVVSGVRGLEDLAVTDIDGDVVRCGCAGACEEDEVARLLLVPGDCVAEGHLGAGVVREAQLAAGRLVGGVQHQSGAVEARSAAVEAAPRWPGVGAATPNVR